MSNVTGRSALLSARSLCALIVTISAMAPVKSEAAGLYFSERGVRPLARGGAYVAGVDDLHGIWHNPAGIYEAGTQLLLDASWLNYTTDYQRRALVEQRDPNTGEVLGSWERTFTEVQGSTPVIPLPTIAASYQVAEEWVVALGMEAPYAALVSYPEEIDGEPSPSRYGLVNLDGSLLSIIGAWVAYAPSDEWRFGLGLEMLVGQFVTTKVMSSCLPDSFICSRESPLWDSLVQLTAGPIVAPSVNGGVIYRPHEQWRLGASVQAPFAIRAPAEINIRLPSSQVFSASSVEGDEADVSFDLPLIARLGVEFRPIEQLRLELAGVYEAWSMHDDITVTPDGVAMRDMPGLPDPYYVAPMVIPRGFQDTGSVRLGGEFNFELFDIGWITRAGASYESSAIPSEYLSVETIDVPKVTLGLGIGMEVDRFQFDLVYAHLFGTSVDVDPATAQVPAQSPVQGHPNTDPNYINGGTYRARANVVGIGMKVALGDILGAKAKSEDESAPKGQE